MNDAIVIQCTASSRDEARGIARALLEAKRAACVSLAGEVESHYWWQGAIESATEVLMLIKTARGQFDAVCETILAHHSYEVPEIIALPVVTGHEPYLRWLDESVRDRGGES
ncbi:MAG: divalent-cation tolerance protein CutA [Verrucomicrobia bacterium]|nr:divalent-cation tolerance protein CutA [Verrucomicrobiota bacterium]